MAEVDLKRPQKTDEDSEKSFSESDLEADNLNDSTISATETPEKFKKRRRPLRKRSSDEQYYADSDSDREDSGSILNTSSEAPTVKAADISEYESAEEEEEKAAEKPEDPEQKEEGSPSELVDEEGGEEGIAETEDVDDEFLNGDAPENASEEEEFVEEERQQGDGEECSPDDAAAEKELDFDEDRRNPQYIPKKGMFYEHDDRNNEDEKEKPEEPSRDRKKKLWLDEGKWGHDRFREEEQYPKSRNELIDTYGYDIRNEDGPPRARRRRRYGRGPTKYDRSWEDVTAYGREKLKDSPRGAPRGRRAAGRFRGGNPRFGGRGQRPFNPSSPRNDGEMLHGNVDENDVNKENGEEIQILERANSPVINREEFPALPTKQSEPEIEEPKHSNYDNSPPTIVETKSVRTLTFENSNFSGRNSIERDIPPRRGKTPPFVSNHERGNRRPNPRGNRGSGRGDYNKRGRSSNFRHISPRFLENKSNNNYNQLSAEMEHLSLEVDETNQICNDVHDDHLENNGELPLSNINVSELPSQALKGAGDSSGRPKRYSSMRQRSLPETSTYPTPPPQQVPPQHPTYYETGYQATLYAPTETPSTQSQTATSAPLITPSPYQTFTPPPYSENYGLRMTPPPRLFPQVSVPQPQPILAPPPCITPAPPIMNFAPQPHPAGYQFAAYPQFPPPPPPPAPAPPAEIFQPGITYYYPPNQPPPSRPNVQTVPKSSKAIPIIPPPEREANRKDRSDSTTSNSSSHKYSDNANESDNVDIVRTESSQTTVGVES